MWTLHWNHIFCLLRSWTCCWQPSTETLFQWSSKAHELLHLFLTVVLRTFCVPQVTTSISQLHYASMAALWASFIFSLPVKAHEVILVNTSLLGRNFTSVAKEAADSIPKGTDFPGLWDQNHLEWFLSQCHILFNVVTVFRSACPVACSDDLYLSTGGTVLQKNQQKSLHYPFHLRFSFEGQQWFLLCI